MYRVRLEQNVGDGRGLRRTFLWAHVAGALVFGQVLHLPGDDRLQRQLFLLGGELAAIGPFADFHGRFQAFVDLRRDVFDHLRERGHSVS
ncbi:hypothetical protein D3C75_1280380 [compost metagenome]